MKRLITSYLILSILGLSLLIASVPVATKPAQAAFNGQINYQGKLTNTSNVAVADGDYNMEFKLYTVSSGGVALWTETRTSGDKVTVTNGVFSIMLGSVTSLSGVDFNQTLYLGVNIGGTGSPSWDGEMTPRKPLGAVPAAFIANSLQGTGVIDITNTGTQGTFNYDGSNRATLAVASNGFTTLTSTGSGAGWNLTGGNVGIGTATTSAKLHVTSTAEQFRTSYDASNYTSFTTSSGGDLTIAPSGSDLAVTGNVDVSGTLTAGTANAFNVNASGQVTAGTWQGTVVGATYGGTGVNNGSNTITLGGNINTAAAFTTSGANALTLTTTGVTNVTLPTSGTLITSGVTALSSLTTIGTITSGTWNATAIGAQYGGTGINTASSTGVPSISSGTWSVNAQLPVSLGGTGTSNGSITGTGALSFTAGSTAQNVNLIPTTTGSVVVSSTTANTDTIQLKPQTTGTGATFAGIITTADITGSDKTYTFPNASITVNAAADISGSTLASGVTASSLTSVGTLSSLALSGAVTGATSYNGLVVTANTGVITTGTWQGSVVGGTYGGTGVNNGSNTITLGGNINTAAAFTTSGANALTLTTTGTTNVTLPTSGTLVNTGVTTLSSLSTVGTITSGTWQGTAVGILYGGTGSNDGSITGSSALTFAAGSTAQNVNLTPSTTGVVKVASSTANTDTIQIKPQTTGTAATFNGILTSADLTGSDKTWTLPNVSGNIITSGDTGTVTNTMLAGSIAASKLVGTDIATVGTLTAGSTGAGFTVALGSSTITGVLTGINGGTGVNNGSNTITLGGNINTAGAFTTAGANALTLTTTGTTNVTLPTSGTLVNTGVTTLSSLSSIGTITAGVWNGTAITDTYVADTLTVDSSSSVHWNALNNYPAACSAGSAISQLADTTNVCTSFNTDTSITLQDAYDATSGNTITTTNNRSIAITLAEVTTPTSFTIENQDTAATSAQRIFNSIASGTATNGLLIEQTGAGTMTNAIQIAETAGTITDGILITGTLGNILNSGSIDITGAGAITGATGVTSSGTITFSGLGGGGTKCVQTDNSGVITAAASACGSSGITIGSTTITSGSNGRILYNNSGTVGEMTTTGSGSVVALATTPTFVTNITTPIVNGSASADGTLTIQGNSTTGNTSTNANLVFKVGDSAGTTAATILNNGNFGIGDASPNSLFTVGSGDLFQINSTGQIGSQQAPVSDYLFALAGASGNDHSRVIDITQANNAAEDTRVISIVNTASPPSVTNLTREIYNTYSSLTPVTSVTGVTGLGELYLYAHNNIVDTSSVTLGDSPNGSPTLVSFGNASTTTFSPILNDTDGGNLSSATAYGTYSNLVGSPTLTSVAGGANLQSYSGYFSNVTSSAGNGSLANTSYGVYATSSGNLTTTGATSHYGGYFATNGSADVNYALYAIASAPGATTNYAAILMGGNVGIGSDAPDKALEVNSATGNNLRLTYNDADGSATNYVDLLTTSGGALTVQPSGFIANIGGGATRTALRFLEPSGIGTDYAAIQSNGNVTTSYTWTLPAADASGCIQSNGSGALSIAACGSALTPWTSDIDADGFDLNDLSNILFRETTGAPTSTDVALYRDNAGDLSVNVLSAKTFNIAVNNTDEYNFSSTGLAFNSNNITGLGTNLTATAGLTITSTSANLALATSTSGDITATTATTGGLFNVLTGNLKVGAGTPGLTLNGDDAYITGTFEVDGATQFDGGLTFNSTAAFNGVATFNTDVDFTFAGTENLSLTNTTGSNAVDLFALTITNNDAGSATQRGLVLTNANSTSTTESLVFLDNADTTASSLTDGILITSSGVNDGITDAIDVSASNITNALNVGANTITGAGYTLTSTASGLTVNSTGANLALQTTTSGNITLAPASTGSVQITSGVTIGTTTSAAVSIAANSLTSGTGLYMASSSLTSGSLIDLQISGTVGASSQKAINVNTTGTITGAQSTYGGYFLNSHSGGTSTNVALYASAISGTNNYAAIFDAGNVGIGTTGPDRKLDVLDASNPQLRLTTTDGSVYSDLQNTSNANLIINGSSLASSSASQFGLQVAPTVAQSSSANYRALDINVTETSTTTLTDLNRLADFRVGGSSKLAVSNNGSLTLQNAANFVTPYGGIGDFQNHLVRSEEFDNASWVKTSVTAPTANTQTAPDGSATAESLATSGSGGDVCQWSGTAASSGTFTFSVWARSTSGTQNFDLRVDAGATSCATANNVTGTAATHTATTSWQRFTVTQTFSGATGNVKARIFPGTTGSTGTIYAWGAQLDQSTRPSNYVLTTGGALTNTNRGQVIESNFATASGFTYGGRHVTTLSGSIAASSSTIGQLIRVIDNASGTDDTATVRALEVQSYSGTNINGVNTAVAAFGYTFGVHAATTGQANEAAQPAAVFADLDNGSAATHGNAIRAYTDNATSADLVSFYQESSAFSGNGLEMNFGNNSGSFTGNFISLQKNGTQSFHVDDDGSTFVSFTGTQTSHAVCHATNGQTNDDELVDCTGTPSADFSEMYPVEQGADVGDIVVTGSQMVNTYDMLANGDGVNWNDVKGQITKLEKSHRSYQSNIIGIVSDNYADFTSTGYNIREQDNPKSIALKGRVLVNVTDENGPIKAGDFITASNLLDGYGTKATRSGQVVGQALDSIDFENNNTGQIMVFVQVGYQSIGNTIVLDAPSANGINLQNGSSSPITNTASTFVIQQQTSGEQDAEANILQLQTGDANRFMVSSTGATSILSNLNCEADADSCPSVLKVTQADTELMNIDARGTLTLAGTIVIKDDTFAGSVVTDEDGLAEITFSYHLGTGKPVVQLTPEAQLPVFAQIVEFKQDDNGNYTGFVIKTFDLISSPVQAIVHYNVTGKQSGYITLGEVTALDEDLPVYSGNGDSGDGVGLVIEGGEVVDNQNDESNSNNDSGTVSGDFTEDNSNDNISNEGESGAESNSESEPGTN